MDTAHTVEEGEDFLEALTAVKPYCNHIHFANCFIKMSKAHYTEINIWDMNIKILNGQCLH